MGKPHMPLTSAHLLRVLLGCFLVAPSLSETRMSLGLVWELPGRDKCNHKTADMFSMTKVTRVNAIETGDEEGEVRVDRQCGGDSPMQQFPILKGVHSKNPSG